MGRNILFVLLLALGLLSFSPNVEAPNCSCPHAGAFMTVAPQARLVALVKIKEHFLYTNENNRPVPMSMEVEIIDVYRGKEDRDHIVVWGNAGNMCRPDVSIFHKERYYVMAFEATGGNPLYDEPNNDYAISICGDFWLAVEDFDAQMATGQVTDEHNTVALGTLKSLLQP
jgi:hypothetical protein